MAGNAKNRQANDFFAIFPNFLKSATRSALVIIDMTNHSEKLRARQKIVKLTIFRKFC